VLCAILHIARGQSQRVDLRCAFVAQPPWVFDMGIDPTRSNNVSDPRGTFHLLTGVSAARMLSFSWPAPLALLLCRLSC
jgi:hypothetical protein